MKCTRKLASLLLALVMVFALATTAFASEIVTPPTKGTITVDNPVADRTYTAYKIFDVVYDAAKEHYSYTIDSSNEWFTTVQGYAGLKLTKVNDTNTYIVEKLDSFSAPSFAETLKAAVANKTAGKPLTVANGSASIGDLDLGYYFVSSDTGALCNLTTTNPTVTIHDKNEILFEKEADATDVEVGQIVHYTITSKVPDYTGYYGYTYYFNDTMSDGLTFNKDVRIMVDGVDVTTDSTKCHYVYDVGLNPNSFSAGLKVKQANLRIGAEIKFTYSATVNEKAIGKTETNKAILTYTNNPSDTDHPVDMPPEIVTVYSSKIVIDKYDAANKDTKLPGAKFVLYKEVTTDAGSSPMYYKWNKTDKKVEWVADKAAATVVTTNDAGEATFGGLADGTYKLEETKAPAGYNPLTAPVEVKVAGSTTDTTKLSVTAEVENKTGTTLPSTGGMGTTIFYILGSILVVAAVVLLVTKKRMSDANR